MINSFLTYLRCELNYSAHTVLSYKTDISQFADFITDHRPESLHLTSITPSDLRSWMLALSEAGISHRSIRRKISAISSLFRFMMRRGAIKENPAAEVPVAQVPRPLPVFIRPSEIREVLDSDSGALVAPEGADDFTILRNHLILLMFYSTGIRLSELISLRDRNVDTNSCELKVLGKRNKERIIPFGPELADEISRYRTLRYTETGDPQPERFFTRPSGEPLYPMLVQRVVKQALQGHTHATRESPHTLRHSFASDMLNNGADISAVRELLGHTSLATTQIYTHVTYKELLKNYKLAHPRATRRPDN